MTKNEYISRYGEEYYLNYREKCKFYSKTHKAQIDIKNKTWRTNNKKRHYQSTKICRENNPEWNLSRICSDLHSVENYEIAAAVNFKGWILHHRLELHSDYSLRYSKDALIKIGLYYHRPANELVFLSVKEHVNIHMKARNIWYNEHRGIPYGK